MKHHYENWLNWLRSRRGLLFTFLVIATFTYFTEMNNNKLTYLKANLRPYTSNGDNNIKNLLFQVDAVNYHDQLQ